MQRCRRRARGSSPRRIATPTIAREFVLLPPARIAAVLLGSAAVFAGAALAATRSITVASASGAAPVLFAGLLVRWYRNRRKRSILSKLPSLLDLLSGHMRAGHSLSESLAETVPLLPAGIREEMAWVVQQHRLGTPLAQALARWEERIRSEETSLLVRPLSAAISGGGNVVDLLERTRDILRFRMRMMERLRSMTAQARLQALVLTLLPPRSRSPSRRSIPISSRISSHSAGENDRGDRARFPGPWVDHHTKDPVGAAMSARDFLLIGAPMLLGGAFLAAFLLRTWKGRSIAHVLRAYRSAMNAWRRDGSRNGSFGSPGPASSPPSGPG